MSALKRAGSLPTYGTGGKRFRRCRTLSPGVFAAPIVNLLLFRRGRAEESGWMRSFKISGMR